MNLKYLVLLAMMLAASPCEAASTARSEPPKASKTNSTAPRIKQLLGSIANSVIKDFSNLMEGLKNQNLLANGKKTGKSAHKYRANGRSSEFSYFNFDATKDRKSATFVNFQVHNGSTTEPKNNQLKGTADKCDKVRIACTTSTCKSAQCFSECPKGYQPSDKDKTLCVPCSAGNAKSFEGNRKCRVCMAGTFSAFSPEGSTGCTPCPTGSSSGPGAARCTSCKPGTFASATGSSTCTPCSAGYFASEAGATGCSKCSAGSSSVEGAVKCTSCKAGFSATAGAATCAPCSSGSFASQAGQANCKNCPAGSSSGPGAKKCTSCKAGTFASSTGASKCTECPAGSSSEPGAEKCTSCKSGTFASSTGASKCTECPAGSSSGPGAKKCTSCMAGTFASTGASKCIACPAGSSSGPGAKKCTSCKAGTFASSTGASKCTACPAGSSSGPGAKKCTSCKAGTFASTGASKCTACPAGSSSEPGAEKCTRDVCPDSEVALKGSKCLKRVADVTCENPLRRFGETAVKMCRQTIDNDLKTSGDSGNLEFQVKHRLYNPRTFLQYAFRVPVNVRRVVIWNKVGSPIDKLYDIKLTFHPNAFECAIDSKRGKKATKNNYLLIDFCVANGVKKAELSFWKKRQFISISEIAFYTN